MAENKTEQPTPKRIQDARKKGQVWRSRDLTALLAFVTAMTVVKATWPAFKKGVRQLFEFGFDKLGQPQQLEGVTAAAISLGLRAVLAMSLPILIAAAVTGAVAEFVIVGPLFAAAPLIPSLEKLNPLRAIKNMFSKRQAFEVIKSVAKIAIAGLVVYGAIAGALPEVALSVRSGAVEFEALLGQLLFRTSFRVAVLFLVFALLDLWFQRRAYTTDMMMSKDDVRQELKESEGDPHHKARRKELALEILQSAQLDAVKDADVIVLNPEHVAVALRYRAEIDWAPRVVCSGVDDRAEAIKAMARRQGIPLLRHIPLARALLEVEIDCEIPEALYDAVAEVLSFVHRLSAGAARAG